MADQDFTTILSPLAHLVSFQQLETLLYAYLPTRLERYLEKTGIYSVDTFLINAVVTLLLVVVRVVVLGCHRLMNRVSTHDKRPGISIVVDPLVQDDYRSSGNVYHQALCRVLSNQAQVKSYGMYRLKPMDDTFHMIPQSHQVETVVYEGMTIQLRFMDALLPAAPPSPSTTMHGLPNPTPTEPPIQVTTLTPGATVSDLSRFLSATATTYTADMARQRRARYEYSQGKWTRICALTHDGDLTSMVALSHANEHKLTTDLATFLASAAFYNKVGLPYRRGYFLCGPPGTGKTSVVLALAAHLDTSVYFMNLGVVHSDTELVGAFASVPKHTLVVFEDVDTQSTVLRQRRREDSPSDEEGFHLSTFLSILDGHTLEDGIVFIMTTNHKEWLDPAVLRPGRMDAHFDLTYATHYQIRRMYAMIQGKECNLTLDKIPEGLIPPSEIMQTMVVYRDKVAKISHALDQLVEKYQSGGV